MASNNSDDKWNFWLLIPAIVGTLVAAFWLFSNPSFEPLITVILGISGIVSLISLKSNIAKYITAALMIAVLAVSIWGLLEIFCKPKPPKIVIVEINYDGKLGRQEPDEYVEIRNDDKSPVNLKNWLLCDKKDLDFRLPDYTMAPGESCRIYTGEDHPEWCGINMRKSAKWNNKGGDCAYLSDSEDNLVAEFCYE